MNETYISTVHSESGRRVGVVIISDDVKFIRDSMKLTEAIRAVYGGDAIERSNAGGRITRKS
ncbi:hypothetical protein A8709_32925 [Paenibacillus pectinilyticus]|uniref:Uncharacterized protein n=2 Tax=Paenibacillus pectinilyticus TaxID=512399 RepID=A0A1C0ZWZ3_9BACL|nr:hypothetical protein A8709_32925 [Paenibacillus pectinilyticus]